MLPRRIPKRDERRATRWRSPAHCAWIRGFECLVCGSQTNIVAAHVRKGSYTGMGQKPDDWRTVPLCDGPHGNADSQLGCHDRQHIVGEVTFWSDAKINPEAAIEEFIKASPKRTDIERIRKERAGG